MITQRDLETIYHKRQDVEKWERDLRNPKNVKPKSFIALKYETINLLAVEKTVAGAIQAGCPVQDGKLTAFIMNGMLQIEKNEETACRR